VHAPAHEAAIVELGRDAAGQRDRSRVTCRDAERTCHELVERVFEGAAERALEHGAELDIAEVAVHGVHTRRGRRLVGRHLDELATRVGHAELEGAKELDVRGAAGRVTEELADTALRAGVVEPATNRRVEIEAAVPDEDHRDRRRGHRFRHGGEVEPGGLVDRRAEIGHATHRAANQLLDLDATIADRDRGRRAEPT